MSTKIGTFTNGTFEKLNVIVSLFSQNHNRLWKNPLVPDGVNCEIPPVTEKKGVQKTPVTAPSVPEVAPDTHAPYVIKKWDSLWKIVKKNYRLSDSADDANLVGNIIELLKKDPKNKGIIKDETGKIFVWETLFLPKNIQMMFKWVQKSLVLSETGPTPATPISPAKEEAVVYPRRSPLAK